VGETTGAINCYNVQAMVNGDILFAQISKVGGKLITFSYAGSCESVDIDDERAVEIGQSFLNDIGIGSVKPVWINLSNNVYTINFAGEQNGVIIYGDLIKVRVCADTSMVIGIEAKSYFTCVKYECETKQPVDCYSLILDKNKFYHCGTSLNRIGFKTFSINVINDEITYKSLLNNVKGIINS
jgi:hypothetical protein